ISTLTRRAISLALMERRPLPEGEARTLIKELGERINRYKRPPAKNYLFLLGVQRDAASANLTVGIHQTEQWRNVAVVGNAPHGDTSIAASANATAGFTPAASSGTFTGAATSTASGSSASTRCLVIVVAATPTQG